MTKELSIQEKIKQYKAEMQKKADIREAKKKAKISLANKAKKQAALLKAKNEKARLDTITTAFKKCCDILKECEGLEVSRVYEKPKYMKKYNFEGMTKYGRGRSNQSHDGCAFLKVGKIKIIAIELVNSETCDFRIELFTYRPESNRDSSRTEYWEDRIFEINKRTKDINDKQYDKMKQKILQYLSKISVDDESERKRIRYAVEVAEKIKASKKIKKDKPKELNADGFKFIDIR
jgi:hypothetical protein